MSPNHSGRSIIKFRCARRDKKLRLGKHRPIHHDGADFADRLDAVQRGAAALIRDPVRDVAVALQGLTHEQKRQVAIALRATVMRLNTWASLMLEARR
jgi:hypothetical protein